MASTNSSGPRIAVVGVGHFGRHHARILSTLPGARLEAVVDIDADRASAVAAETGTIAIAYAATQLTKPIRIVLFLALTPPIAHWWARRRAAQGS